MKIVVMQSDVYGIETFEYPTARAAEAGRKRLIKSAKKYEKQDGVKRKIWVE